MELRDATTDKTLKLRRGFKSHLPVEFDQSNSVIAHLAMISGQRDVADIANMLRYSDFYREIAEEWDIDGSNFKMDIQHRRKIVKKIVVPRCYGAGATEISRQIRKLEDKIPFIKNCSDAQLTAIAENGIQELERRVPVLTEFRRNVGRRIRALDLQNNPDAEVAWSTASEFECHVRPVPSDRDEFQLPNQCYEINIEAREMVNHCLNQDPISNNEFIGQMSSIKIRCKDPFELQKIFYNEYRIIIPIFEWNDEMFLRFSIQAYNSIEDIEKLIFAIKKINL